MARRAFKAGDRVAWHPEEATRHAPSSVLRESALPDDAQFGTVKDASNDEGTWFDVKMDDGKTRALTFEELVKVEPDE